MCVDYRMKCHCGSNSASFNLKEEVMPFEVVDRLYCPLCSDDVAYNPETMINDNGWIIQYDMDVARSMGKNIPAGKITPHFLFDEGYCTWRGVYPTDHIDSVKEREEIIKLAKVNPKKYFEEMRMWGNKRMERLTAEGWRKASEREDLRVQG
jgi:hypothetical protein